MSVMSDISIRTKLTVGSVFFVFFGIGTISVVSYFAGKALLKQATVDKLITIRNIKAGQVVQYIAMLREHCLSTSERIMIFDAMEDFKNGFAALSASPEELERHRESLKKFYIDEFLPKLNQTATTQHSLQDYFPLDMRTILLQDWYLAENPYSLQKKSDMMRAPTAHIYNTAHEKHHPFLKRYAKRFGMSDIYLIDTQGNIVYSLAKEVDIGTNLMTGPFKDSILGKSFIEIQRSTDENFVKITDLQFYDPSYGIPSGFIGTPIYYQGQKVGGLIFQFPINELNAIMTYDKQWVEAGLGQTGESFLMGKDKLMRTVARQYLENPTEYLKVLREQGYDATTLDKIQVYDTTVLLEKIHVTTAKEALENKINTIITIDSSGKEIISTYAPVRINDVDWYIFVEIDTAEAFAPIKQLLWQICLWGLLILMLSVLGVGAYIWYLTKPLLRMIQYLRDDTTSIMHKISLVGSSEFTELAQVYNRIVEHVNAIFSKIHSVKEYLEESNGAMSGHYLHLQEMTADITIANNGALENNKKVGEVSNQLNVEHEYTITHVAQGLYDIEGIKNSIKTLTENIESSITHLASAEKYLLLAQEAGNVSNSDERNAHVMDVKSSIQSVVRLLNTSLLTIAAARDRQDQFSTVLTTMKKKEEECRVVLQRLRIAHEECQKYCLEITKKIESEHEILRLMNVSYLTYVDLAQQLTILVQEFDI